MNKTSKSTELIKELLEGNLKEGFLSLDKCSLSRLVNLMEDDDVLEIGGGQYHISYGDMDCVEVDTVTFDFDDDDDEW